jgi:hypothetical protein
MTALETKRRTGKNLGIRLGPSSDPFSDGREGPIAMMRARRLDGIQARLMSHVTRLSRIWHFNGYGAIIGLSGTNRSGTGPSSRTDRWMGFMKETTAGP